MKLKKNPEKHVFIQNKAFSGTPVCPQIKRLKSEKLWQIEKPFFAVDMGLDASFLESSGKKSTKRR